MSISGGNGGNAPESSETIVTSETPLESKPVDVPVPVEEKPETAAQKIEREIKAIESIKEFTVELFDTFGKKKKGSALQLYNRLLKSIELDDATSIQKIISGFNEFFMFNSSYIIEDDKLDNIPRGTIIKYGSSSSICIEIQHYVSESNKEPKEILPQHLLVIYSLLNPKSKEQITEKLNKSIESLNIDTSSNEGKLLTNFFATANENLSQIPQTDNPLTAITGLLSSPAFSGLLSNLQNGFKDGNLNENKLLSTLTGAMGSMMSDMNNKKSRR